MNRATVRGSTHVLWRRLDRPGHEAARLIEADGWLELMGTAVFAEGGEACRLDYHITCDGAGQTRNVSVNGWHGASVIQLEIEADAERRWLLNGVGCADVDGCADIDLSFSPSTNTLPIRRLTPRIGQRFAVRAAWLRFPECALEPLDQIYERMTSSTYRYESNGGQFEAYLKVDDRGFVTSYPGLWRRAI
jgi:hypothetical protein